MYSTNNKGKSVLAERFIRTLKRQNLQIHDFNITYNDKLDNIVNEYNNTHHRTTKMKPIDVKDNTYIDSSREINNKDAKFHVGDHV